MKVQELRKKRTEELKIELLNLLRRQFNIRIQTTNDKLPHTYLLKRVRRNIARVKTLLTER